MKNVAVIFGGKSSEHDISVLSARAVVAAIDREKYDISLIYIDREGRWFYWNQNDLSAFTDAACEAWGHTAYFAPWHDEASRGKARLIVDDKYVKDIDLVYPVMHGLNGEDGTIQGYLEMLEVPYVGCGVLASAAAMDKLTTKRLVEPLGIRQARYVSATGHEALTDEDIADRVEAALPYPVFVKPSNAGSSIGVSRAADRAELLAAIALARANDNRILIEEEIVGREVECSVLGNFDAKAAGIGEVLAADEFYTYDAKYTNVESKTDLAPKFPAETIEEIRRDAVAIFKAIDGRGLSRVDFFVEKKSGEVVFNEINTMPGFTSISMYPKLWDVQGKDIKILVNELMELGFAR